MLECVVNISEGADLARVATIAQTAGDALLDVHSDTHHNRSVLTLVGEAPVRAVTTRAVELLDLRAHHGVHPRLGVVDVVPFVPLGDATLADAVAARDRYATWVADTLGVPAFLYGPERSLPEVRRGAFRQFPPDTGPPVPHATAGAVAVGARPLLVAYNLWLAHADLALARRLAAEVRGPRVRALGLPVGHRVQVSLNLVDPLRLGPAEIYDRVDHLARGHGNAVTGAELVGLVPRAVLDRIAPGNWPRLDLAAERTIEARLEDRGADGAAPRATPGG